MRLQVRCSESSFQDAPSLCPNANSKRDGRIEQSELPDPHYVRRLSVGLPGFDRSLKLPLSSLHFSAIHTVYNTVYFQHCPLVACARVSMTVVLKIVISKSHFALEHTVFNTAGTFIGIIRLFLNKRKI